MAESARGAVIGGSEGETVWHRTGRIGMVAAADLFPWSSAALHCGGSELGLPLRVDRAFWEEAWDAVSWREFLEQADAACDLDALRASTQSGRLWARRTSSGAWGMY